MQFHRPCLGSGKAQQGGIGGFVQGIISTLLFANNRSFAFYIKDVIPDLEGQPDTFTIVVQMVKH